MSEIKVNKISPRAACGTVQLGDSGDTFTIPAGASITNSGTASGFGATGSASWNTTVKTGDFTAVAGEGYFVNTTSGAINVTLPAGTAGAVVAIKDYAGTFDTNNLTLTRNGSDKIGGQAVNATISTEGIAVTLVFVDSTQGWLVTDSGLQDEAPTATFITATGGTVTTDGNFKVHTFTGPGTFTVCSTGNPFGSDTVSYMVVAGGASAGLGDSLGAGGGAGGFREGRTTTCSYTASPLNAPAGLPVSAQGYPIVVGAGGSAPSTGSPSKPGNSGSNSSFSTIISAGGGAGGGWPDVSGTNGGSGGGSGNGGNTKGDGNTPPVSPPQGFDGGNRCNAGCGVGGGGGATAAGSDASTSNSSGGAGATTSINGSATAFAGGGGGASVFPGPAKVGGTGGGGPGGYPGAGTNGTTNTGGGGGGNGPVSTSPGNGGSGIVIIRYKFQ
jgi:hypothetical protein